MTFLISILLALVSAQAAPPLRIVVIEGEGAVNIVQQKTAVSPLVEVRDRNDQPVAGAIVNFVVRNGRATFSGARTLSVTTNAAGRAVATGFAPSGSGALQIGATATFQGQTAAAVTIAQTNVMTAAEAAAASASAGAGGSSGGSAAGGGAAGGGGGGMSATTIGIVAGSVAAGAIVAKETVLSGGTNYKGQFNGVMPDTVFSAPGSPPFSCTQNEQQTGTIEITLDSTEGSISGTMDVSGDIVLSPGTCPPGDYNNGGKDSFGIDHADVTGSPDNITSTGHHQNDYTNTTGGGVNAYDFTFSGRLDGEHISGALTIVRNVTYRGNDGNASGSHGTVTYQVVLQK